jgi:hypothetical protein
MLFDRADPGFCRATGQTGRAPKLMIMFYGRQCKPNIPRASVPIVAQPIQGPNQQKAFLLIPIPIHNTLSDFRSRRFDTKTTIHL